MEQTNEWEYATARFLARWILGLLFFMAGWFKVFDLGAVVHAEEFFVQGYADTWIPAWLLWALGFAVPFLELASGGLLILGFRVRECAWTIGGILILVTYGHLLTEPMFDITTHIFPRSVLLLILLLIPRGQDRWSVDGVMAARSKKD